MKTLTIGTLMLAAVVGVPSRASATNAAGTAVDSPGAPSEGVRASRRTHLVPSLRLADSVVVTPQGSPPPAAVTPVAPVAQAAPVQPVVAEPTTRKVVHAEVQPNRNYMSTIALSALMGGVAGGLVGGAIYYLGDRDHAVNIAYWAAGGVLVGTGVGIVQLMVQEGRVSEATALRKLPSDPAPTFRLALFRTSF